ncbi:MAG: response regulator [Halomonadaceae bacterium]|nr:MAG: response regulator [Halomonadaceae bacterium]
MSRGQALIVDDSATARIMLSRLLEKANFASRGVASAEDALRELQTGEPPSVIFLDHLLPGMNGFEALRAIKRNPQTADIPVFMYTSQNAERYLEEARALGAEGVISKQTNRDQLMQCLEKAAAGHDSASMDLSSMAEDIHVVYHKGLEEQGVRRLTGRLSTLEVAYEDMHDELRKTRLDLKVQESENRLLIEQKLRHSRWIDGGLFMGLVLCTVLLWGQVDSVNQAAENVQSQALILTNVIGHILEMVNER